MFKRLKIVAFSILCAILSLSLVFTSVAPAEAAKKVKMPTKVTEYEYYIGRWVKRRYITYTYNSKGDCTKTSCTYYDSDGYKDFKTTIKLKYTYKKGKKTKVVATGPYEKHIITYDKKQRISKIQAYDEDSGANGNISLFIYDSKGYIQTIDRTTDNSYYTDKHQIWTYDTTVNGSTAAITFDGNDFYGDPMGPEVSTLKSSLLLRVQNDQRGYVEDYTYTKAKKGTAKGLVTTKYCTRTWRDGYVEKYKTKYSYGKKKSSKTKYYKVINDDKRVVVANLYYGMDDEEKIPYHPMQDSSDSDFIINNHVLEEYIGNDEEVVVPDDVTRIGPSAFETCDDYPKDRIKKITVPGTVKVIDEEAFAFCYADVIIIEEGCEKIGDRAFMDSYPDDVTLPASLTKIGKDLFETEEGLNGTKFHVVKGSPIDLAIQKQNPYGRYEIVYD